MPPAHANESPKQPRSTHPVSRVASQRRAARSIELAPRTTSAPQPKPSRVASQRRAARSIRLAVASASLALTGLCFAIAATADTIPRTTAICVPGADGPKAGVVIAISGAAWAVSEHCGAPERRALACGVLLFEDEHVVTGAGANVAFEIEQTQVYVGPDSDLRVATGENGAPDLLLVAGRARAVDRDDVIAPGRRLATPDLVSVGRGDTEANAPAGAASSICEYARPISLGDGSHSLAPGSCAGPSFVASDVTTLGVSLLDAGLCNIADARRFDPTDVASGPSNAQPFPSPLVPGPPPPVCQAGTCTSVNPGPPTSFGVVESTGVNETPPP